MLSKVPVLPRLCRRGGNALYRSRFLSDAIADLNNSLIITNACAKV